MKTAVRGVLDSVSTEDLMKYLHDRMTPLEKLVWPYYDLVPALTPLPCVDSVPVRRYGGDLQIGLGLRGSGYYSRRWWIFGGRIKMGESFGIALTRIIRTDLGVGFHLALGNQTWNRPVFVSQQGPTAVELLPGEVWGHEPSKQCPSNTYVVELESDNFKFGSTPHGGQEILEVRWFRPSEIPWDDLAYGGRGTIGAVVEWIQQNAPLLGYRSR